MKIIQSMALFLATSCGCAIADDWQSPVEAELENSKPAIYEEYKQARTLIDGYRGNPADMQQAHQLLIGVQKKDRNQAPVLRELGRLYIIAAHFGGDRFDQRTLKVAEDSILHSISIAPKYEDAYVLLGHLYTKSRQYQKATDALDQATTLGSNSPWLKLNLAEVYVKTKRYDDALSLVQEVLERGTSNTKAETTAYTQKINIHWALGSLDAVKQAHQDLLSAQADEAQHWGNYASFLLYAFSDTDGAITAAEKALSILDYQDARLTMAVALYTQWAHIAEDAAREDEAAQIYDKATSSFPDYAQVIKVASRNAATKEVASKLAAYLELKTK
ncbi:MAG: tetratricopeptide repeat protein [Granulosicoccaceae bacterium]